MSDSPPTYQTIAIGPLDEIHRAAGPYVDENLGHDFPSSHYTLWRYEPVSEARPRFLLSPPPRAYGYYKIYRVPEIWSLNETDLENLTEFPAFLMPEIPYWGYVPKFGYLPLHLTDFGSNHNGRSGLAGILKDRASAKNEVGPAFNCLNDYQKQLWSIIQTSGLKAHFFEPFASRDARQIFAQWIEAINTGVDIQDYYVLRTNALRVYLVTLAWCISVRVMAHAISSELESRLKNSAQLVWNTRSQRDLGQINALFKERFNAINPTLFLNESVGVVFSGATADSSVLKIIRSGLICFDLILHPRVDPVTAGSTVGHIYVSPNCANVSRDSQNNTSLFRHFPLNITAFKVEWWSDCKLKQSNTIRDANRARRTRPRDSDEEDHQPRYDSSDEDEVAMSGRPTGLYNRQRTTFTPLANNPPLPARPPQPQPATSYPLSWGGSPSWENPLPPPSNNPRVTGTGWEEVLREDANHAPSGWGTPLNDPWVATPLASTGSGAAAPANSVTTEVPVPSSTHTSPPTAAPESNNPMPNRSTSNWSNPTQNTSTWRGDSSRNQRFNNSSYRRGDYRGQPNRNHRGRNRLPYEPVRHNYNNGPDNNPSRSYDSYRPRYETPTPERTPSPPPAYVPADRTSTNPSTNPANSANHPQSSSHRNPPPLRESQRPPSPIRTEAAPPPTTYRSSNQPGNSNPSVRNPRRQSPLRSNRTNSRERRSRQPSPPRSYRASSRERRRRTRSPSRDRDERRQQRSYPSRSRSRSRSRDHRRATHPSDQYASRRRSPSRSLRDSRSRSRSRSASASRRSYREGTPYSEASRRSSPRRTSPYSRSPATYSYPSSSRPTPEPETRRPSRREGGPRSNTSSARNTPAPPSSSRRLNRESDRERSITPRATSHRGSDRAGSSRSINNLPEDLEPLIERMIEERLAQRQPREGNPDLVWENVEAGGSSGGRRTYGQRLIQPTLYNTPSTRNPNPRNLRNPPYPDVTMRPSASLSQRLSDHPVPDRRPLARRIQGYENAPLEASPTPLRSRIGEYGVGAENPILLAPVGDNPPQYGYNHVPEAFWYWAIGLAPEDSDWHRVILIEHNSYHAALATEPEHRGLWTFPQLFRRFLRRHLEVWPMLAEWRSEMRFWRGRMQPIPAGHSWHRDYFYVDGVDTSSREITNEDQDWLINVIHTVNAPKSIAGPIVERFSFPPRFIPADYTSENLRLNLSEDDTDDEHAIAIAAQPAVADGDESMNVSLPPNNSVNNSTPSSSTPAPTMDEYAGTSTGSPMRSEDARAYED